MARIFITGSADGLGQLAAQDLVSRGHQVVLHARNGQRADGALAKVPGAQAALAANLGSVQETIELAHKANALGRFDAVIHNAGIYRGSAEEVFAVNTLAPYILTCLMEKPERLVYLSSGLHLQGHFALGASGPVPGRITYSDTKLHVLMLAKAVARTWPQIRANAVNPGWVPTKMGGAGAPDDLQKGYETQVWLATGPDAAANASGRYFFHRQERPHNREADEVSLQEQLLAFCKSVTGVSFE